MRTLVYGSPPRRLVPGQHGQNIIDRPMLKGIVAGEGFITAEARRRRMASKKVIIGAVIVVAIIAIAAIAMSGSTQKDPNARYNYGLKEIDSYTSITGTTQTPDEGKKFILLTVAIYNDSCDKAITTNPYIFEWSVSLDGIRHTYLDDESLYPTPSSVEIEKGGHANMVYCWQVDKSADITTATVSFELSSSYHAIFKQDTSIIV